MICPQHDNAGKSLQHVEAYAIKALVAAFGGVTVDHAKGHWRDASGAVVSEPVWRLITAYEPSAANDAKLASVARYIGAEGNQEAVYVRFASGDVEIVETKQRVAA